MEASRETVRYSTWRRYEQIVRCQLIPHLGQHQLSRLTPGHVETLNNLGVLYKERGREDQANASYTRAIALKPDQAEAHSRSASR